MTKLAAEFINILGEINYVVDKQDRKIEIETADCELQRCFY